MRPLLLPTLSRLWRDATTLQLGVDPGRAVVIAPVDVATSAFLTSLDGRSRLEEVLARAPTVISAASARELLSALIDHGAVVDAESHPGARPSRNRRGSSVLLRCRGQLGPVVAVLLAAAGVGRVVISGTGVVTREDVAVGGLGPNDVGRPYAVATTEAVHRMAPEVDTRLPAGDLPDLVVLAAGPLPAPSDQVRWTSAGVPHLPVLLRDGAAIVGPLVLPGRTACLTCIEHHRRDRDPAWPVLAAQLATEQRPEVAEAVVVTMAAALAAGEVAGHLDGLLTATAGVSMEVGPPGEPLRQREWSPHPRCNCLA